MSSHVRFHLVHRHCCRLSGSADQRPRLVRLASGVRMSTASQPLPRARDAVSGRAITGSGSGPSAAMRAMRLKDSGSSGETAPVRSACVVEAREAENEVLRAELDADRALTRWLEFCGWRSWAASVDGQL